MAREIYNKNAREKVLLEQAYAQVYTETSSVERIRRQMEGHPEHGDLFKHPKYGKYLYDLGEYGRSAGPGNEPPNPASPYYDLELSDAQVYRDGGYPDTAEKIEQAFGAESEEGNTLEAILPTLEFKETTKQAKQYQYTDSSQDMPAMSYTVVQQQQPVVTVTSDGKETQNTAEPNDIIMSGPSREQYVVKPEKFPKLYAGKIGGTVTPEQSPRIVARVENITQPITFKAPWGEDMILKRGDYLVKDGDQGYYRIAQKEYDETYNPI